MKTFGDAGEAGHKIDAGAFSINLEKLGDQRVEQMPRTALDQQDARQRGNVAAEEVAQLTIVPKLKYLDNFIHLSA